MNRVTQGLGVFAALLPLVAAPIAGAATTLAGQPLPDPPAEVVIINPINGWVQAINGYPTPRPGYLCDLPGNTCTNVEWPFLSIPEGVTAFDAALKAASASGEPIIVSGYSQGGQVAQQWLIQHLDDPNAPSPQDLTFVLFGNSTRLYGGSLVYFGGQFGGLGDVWPTSPYSVIDVARQYEYSADMPDNIFSPFYGLAFANALAGGWYLHDYVSVEQPSAINDPANTVWKVGNITYVLIPTENLPLLDPLRQFGLTALADALNAPLKALIDTAYNRDYPGVISPGVILSPQSAQTITLDAAALRVSDSNVQPGEDLGTAMGFADAQQDIQAGAATVSRKTIQAGAATVPEALHQPDRGARHGVKDGGGSGSRPGLDTPGAAVDNPTPTQALDTPNSVPEVPLINVKRDSLKADPGQLGPKHRKPGGGLTDALTSVQDTMNSTIKKITNGLKSGGGKTGEPSASEVGTGDNSE